jgi:hypothetical protein
VSSGIDPAFGPPAPAREWDWSLLYVGRIDRRKGLGTALAALEHLPEATLTVAGDGPDAPMLAGHPRVRRLGHVPHAEVADVYAVCDAVVFPVEWEEPWGLVPLEAMACGRPVLATGRGGSAEYLVDGVNSVLFAAGDAEALAAGVRRLSGDRALRERLREGGRVTARAHTAAAANAEIEATLVRCRRLVSNVERNLRNPPSIAIVDRHSWRDADADVLLFLGDPDPDPALIAQHAEAHRRHPDENVGIQGAVAVPRTAFARWLQRRGHPPLPAPAAGEVGPAYLDLRNASVKRAFMEPFSTDLDLAYRLSERGFRLRYEPQAGASVDVTLAGVRSCLPAAAQAERAFVREHPHLVPRLHDRAAHAAAAGPARGRLGRALVAHVPETVPVLGPRVWRNATEHYDRLLAPAVLEGWD